MAEATLVRRYLRYKAGTTKVVDWLANAARDCEDVTDILGSMRSTRQAKQTKKNNPVPEQHIKVNTSQMLRLAAIVSRSSKIVPMDIIDTIDRVIDRVIDGRRHCADWYNAVRGNSSAVDAIENSGHKHFITVLKETRSLLAKRCLEAAPPASMLWDRSTPEEKKSDVLSMTNAFGYLHVENPSSNALGSAPKPSGATKTTRFELEDAQDEKELAIWCLFEDLQDVRTEIKHLWRDYKEKKISLVAVSVLTGVALSLLRFAQADFDHHYSDLSSYALIMDHLRMEIKAVGTDILLCPSSSDGDHGPEKRASMSQEFIDLTFPKAYLIMLAVQDSLKQKKSGSKPLETGGLSAYFGLHPFGQLLQPLMPDFKLRKSDSGLQLSYFEHFTQGLNGLSRNRGLDLSLWLIAACQINLDIHDIIQFDGIKELANYRSNIGALQDSMRKLMNGLQVEEGSSLLSHFSDLEERLGAMAEDPYENARKHSPGESGNECNQESLSFRVHKAIPARMGTLTFMMATVVHLEGIMLGNSAAIGLSAAYLYKVALLTGAITKPWKDMEFIIAAQSRKRPFVVIPANGIASMFKWFGVSLGMKLSDFARNKRAKVPKVEFVIKHMRRMEIDWPIVTEIMKGKGESDSSDPHLPVVNAAISSLDRLQKLSSPSDRARSLAPQHKETGKLTPSQLLFAFKDVFIADELDFHFNYIEFLFTCPTLLRVIGELHWADSPHECV